MEVANAKEKEGKTQFNTDIRKQFVPYWNGLLHLVGRFENGVIIRRYDWGNIIRECEAYEKDYMNTESFCESCGFFDVPTSAQRIIDNANSRGIYDCKMIAKDNDIVYTYCARRHREYTRLLVILGVLCLIFLFVIYTIYKDTMTVAPTAHSSS